MPKRAAEVIRGQHLVNKYILYFSLGAPLWIDVEQWEKQKPQIPFRPVAQPHTAPLFILPAQFSTTSAYPVTSLPRTQSMSLTFIQEPSIFYQISLFKWLLLWRASQPTLVFLPQYFTCLGLESGIGWLALKKYNFFASCSPQPHLNFLAREVFPILLLNNSKPVFLSAQPSPPPHCPDALHQSPHCSHLLTWTPQTQPSCCLAHPSTLSKL